MIFFFLHSFQVIGHIHQEVDKLFELQMAAINNVMLTLQSKGILIGAGTCEHLTSNF